MNLVDLRIHLNATEIDFCTLLLFSIVALRGFLVTSILPLALVQFYELLAIESGIDRLRQPILHFYSFRKMLRNH